MACFSGPGGQRCGPSASTWPRPRGRPRPRSSNGARHARLVAPGTRRDDAEIVRLFGCSDLTGIDCPVGWPDAFLPFIAGHLAGNTQPVLEHGRHRRPPAAGIPGHRPVRHGPDRPDPLSVSADRVAHPAMRCAVINGEIGQEYGLQPRDGSGRLAEVYPAASLKTWPLLPAATRAAADRRPSGWPTLWPG